MKSRKLKVGVVGVGALGRHHLRLYKECENAEVVGIFDTNPEAAERISEEFGVKVFDTIDALADQCEGLSIAVPADLHHQIACPLLEKGKHLLIEKPIAVTVEHAGEIVRLAKENQVVLEVGHTERYNPAMSYLERRAAKTRFIEAHRLASYPPHREGSYPRGTEVSVVVDLMIHDLEIILHLVDSPVEDVEATGVAVLSKTEDIANARIKFKNGCVANVTASRISPAPLRKIRVFQDDAYIALDFNEKSGFIYKKGFMGIDKQEIPVKDSNALKDELINFIKCANARIETGVMPELKVSGKHGLEALRLAVKISEEIKAHHKKYDLNPDALMNGDGL